MKDKKVLKDFNIDFDDLTVNLPDNSYFKVNISELLIVNNNIPAAVLKKLSECSGNYARFGIIRANIISYRGMLQDELDNFDKQCMYDARKKLADPKATEGRIREKAYLDNADAYDEKKKVLRRVSLLDEKLHRIMRAIEMQSEGLRTVASNLRKEQKLIESDDITVNEGSLKNIKRRK